MIDTFDTLSRVSRCHTFHIHSHIWKGNNNCYKRLLVCIKRIKDGLERLMMVNKNISSSQFVHVHSSGSIASGKIHVLIIYNKMIIMFMFMSMDKVTNCLCPKLDTNRNEANREKKQFPC